MDLKGTLKSFGMTNDHNSIAYSASVGWGLPPSNMKHKRWCSILQ